MFFILSSKFVLLLVKDGVNYAEQRTKIALQKAQTVLATPFRNI